MKCQLTLKKVRTIRELIDRTLSELQTGGIKLDGKNLYDTVAGRRGLRNALLKAIKQTVEQ